MSTELIACLGGTFNPVHNGHLAIAKSVANALAASEVRFIPCQTPVHRANPGTTTDDRLAMLRAALTEANEARFNIDPFELNSDEPNYTFITLTALRAQHPKASLVWIIGDDAFELLPTWYRWRELFHLAHFVVVARPTGSEPDRQFEDFCAPRLTSNPDDLHQNLSGHVFRLPVTPHPANSTAIRAALYAGTPDSIRDLLPAPVLAYIVDHHLYSQEKS